MGRCQLEALASRAPLLLTGCVTLGQFLDLSWILYKWGKGIHHDGRGAALSHCFTRPNSWTHSRAEKSLVRSARGPAARMTIRCPRIQDGKITWVLQMWAYPGSSFDLLDPGNSRETPLGWHDVKTSTGKDPCSPLPAPRCCTCPRAPESLDLEAVKGAVPPRCASSA